MRVSTILHLQISELMMSEKRLRIGQSGRHHFRPISAHVLDTDLSAPVIFSYLSSRMGFLWRKLFDMLSCGSHSS